MALPVNEFIIFKLKASVRPEDPSSEEGHFLNKIFHGTKQQSGHQSSSWGRSVEDENTVVWVVVWADEHHKSQSDLLTPFLEPDTEVLILHTTTSPPISETETLLTNPVTEICPLSFPSSLTPTEHKKLNEDLVTFRTALTEKLPAEIRAKSWSMGQVDRPGTFQNPKSPSGEAFVYLLAVGWENVDAHMKARGTKEFGDTIQAIREKMIPSVQGLTMRHVSFRKI